MENNSNFIKSIMKEDLESGKHKKIITRFPPEPSGFLHIGHAKAIVTSFELAKNFNGDTNIRFDDTNPLKEEAMYSKSIQEDVEWLGYTPKEVHFASDYFDEFYKRAMLLVEKGLAFVCDLTPEEIREYHGDIQKEGKESPYKTRTIEENKKLFEDMRNGVFKEGEKVLRVKIDMKSPNMNMRDPIIYRISNEHHGRTKNNWPIYPMYDFAHPLGDAIEGITHSLCSLEFEDHRPLYNWFIEHTEMEKKPRQIEFSRLNVPNAITSKRYLKQLIDNGIVDGWDDIRIPTIRGMRRRGYTKDGIKNFVLESGLGKVSGTADINFLEHFIRQDLQSNSPVIMAVLNPVRVVIENLEDNHIEYVKGANHPKNEEFGEREIAFTKEIFIEREDFILEKPNRKWKRASLNNEVRLRHAYFIKPNRVETDSNGLITTIYATYDKETKSGSGFKDRKPDGTIHFVSATHNEKCLVNIPNNLIVGDYNKTNFLDKINKNSLDKINAYIESSVDNIPLKHYQFIRNGYFVIDLDSKEDNIIINKTVGLKSSFK